VDLEDEKKKRPQAIESAKLVKRARIGVCVARGEVRVYKYQCLQGLVRTPDNMSPVKTLYVVGDEQRSERGERVGKPEGRKSEKKTI